MSTTTCIITMAVCLLFSAYFSATETAFSSASTTRLKTLAEKGNANAALACRLLEQYDRLLSTILIGNNIVNIATASIGTVLFVNAYGDVTDEQLNAMTDEEYARALEGLAGGRRITAVIVDPSAASFIEVLRRKGWRVRKAENDVLSGIRLTSDLLKAGKIVICEGCADCLREMDEYVWDLSGGGKDKVRKEHDHAMDDMRYFAATVLGERQEGVSAWAVERRR